MISESICVRKILPIFFICTLNLLFGNPWLTFLSEQKKTHTVLNKPQNAKFTFINFFSKCWTGHLKCAFDNPEQTFSLENRCFRWIPENFHPIIFASGNFSWKCSSAQVGYGFEYHALLFCWRSKFFLLKVEICLKKTFFSRLISPILFSPHADRWFDTPDQRILQQRQINHSNSKNDHRKIKLFRKTNLFSSKHFPVSPNSCCKKAEENFLTKSPFFHLEVRRSLQSCSILKKNCFPQKFLKVRRLQFWQPCR